MAASLALIVGLVAASSVPGHTQATGQTMPLRLASSTPLLWPHSRIANSAGLWAKHSLTVDQIEFATGREAMQTLLGGRAEVAEVAPTPLVLAAFAGQPVRAFAVVSRWSEWRVLVRADRGIGSPAQLQGKKVGISVGTSSELAFSYFLETHGVRPAGIEFVNVSPPDMIPAIQSGSVDAINIWQPHQHEAERRLGAAVKAFPYKFTNNYLLLTTTDVVKNNRELLRRTFAVMVDADKIMEENRTQAIEWAAKAARMTPDAVRTIWSEMEFGTKAPDARVLEEMQRFADFAVKKKLVREGSKVPDLKSLFLEL